MTQAISLRAPQRLGAGLAASLANTLLWPLQALASVPVFWFLVALTAMLLRHPDVAFYEIDRVAFGLLVMSAVTRAVLERRRLFVFKGATWPMIGLTALAISSVAGQPYDNQTWCLLAAKFIVPFALFHLAAIVFADEDSLRKFEIFSLIVLAYLSFTAIAFLVGAKCLIFPRFILDESLGYQPERARGPLLQAVANGVSLNLLGILALHSARRGALRGLKALVLLGSVPLAILATMTRAVWLSFAGSVLAIIARSGKSALRRAVIAASVASIAVGAFALFCPDLCSALADRFEERGPVDFRQAVYRGSWQMFLERPLTGWGINQMPGELARHVSGYRHPVLYPHNTYLELLVEHGIAGLLLYLWLMRELWKLGGGAIPQNEQAGYLNAQFHKLWPLLLAVYWVNAALVVMNYQFVNGFLFTLGGMLAGQQRRANQTLAHGGSAC